MGSTQIPNASAARGSPCSNGEGMTPAFAAARLESTDLEQAGRHEEQAGRHLTLVKNFSTSLGNPCGPKCLNKGKCALPFTTGDILQAHEYSCGTTVYDESNKKWDITRRTRETSARWREQQQSFMTFSSIDKLVFNFVVAGRVTCENYARVAYGIPTGT
eukprot:4595233-Pleurochrysis_carterae.AAC.1